MLDIPICSPKNSVIGVPLENLQNVLQRNKKLTTFWAVGTVLELERF